MKHRKSKVVLLSVAALYILGVSGVTAYAVFTGDVPAPIKALSSSLLSGRQNDESQSAGKLPKTQLQIDNGENGIDPAGIESMQIAGNKKNNASSADPDAKVSSQDQQPETTYYYPSSVAVTTTDTGLNDGSPSSSSNPPKQKSSTSSNPSKTSSDNTSSKSPSSADSSASSNSTEPTSQGGSGSQPQSIPISSVTLNETAFSLIKGDTATLKATVAPAGTTQSKTVTWSSSDTSVATVDSDGVVTAVEGGSAKITAKSVNGKTADCFVTVTVPATGIEIHATPFEIDRGDSRTLTATVLPTDATDKSVSWATSDSSIVAVDENGKITAEAPGAATITAATADGKYSESCAVNVIISISSLNLNKTTDTIIKGATDALTATIDPPDTTEDKTVTWTTTDPAVATVDSDGVVTAVEGGTTTITAQAGSHFAECVVTVIVPVTGISIFPDASIEKGTQQSLMVTFTPSDATDRAVTWTTSNPDVATVDEDGKITAVSVGSTAITATSHDGGFTATCNVSVVIHVTGVTLDQTSLTLIKGAMQTLTAIVQPAEATDKTLLWSSSNPDVATVDSTGAVTAVEGGTAVITAKSKDGGKTAQCAVTVKVPVTGVSVTPSLTIEKGTQQGLTATITPADATDKAVAWSSSDPDIASVDAGGNITAVSVGHATVTATSHDGGFTASCDVSVVIHVTGVSLYKTTV